MKHTSLLKTLFLLCSLIVGSSAWGVEQVYYTLDGTTTGGTNGYAEESAITQSEMDWGVVGNTTTNPWRIGGKSLSGVDRIAYSKTAMGEAITKVSLSIGAASSITINSVKLIVSTAANGGGTKIDEVTKTSVTANSTLTFNPTTPLTEWAKDSYYKFVFNVTVSGSSNKFVEFKSADFYYDKPTTATLSSISISGTYPTEFYVGDAFSHEGMTVTAHYSDASTLDVTSSATFSGYNMSTSGAQEVTVSYEESSITKTATYDITVNPVPPVVLTLNLATNILGLPEGSSKKTTTEIGYDFGGYTYTIGGGGSGNGYYYNATDAYLLMGKDGSYFTFPAYPFKVKRIKVYGRGDAGATVKFNIFVGEDAICDEVTSSKVDHLFDIPSAHQAIGTVYSIKTTTTNANMQITKIEIMGDGEAVEVSAAGLATFASDNKLDFTNVPDLEAYIAKENGSKIELTQVKKVPAGTGVLLRAKNGTTAFGVPVTTASADDVTGNIFVRGNDAAVATGSGPYNYVLGKKSGVVGFYKANGAVVNTDKAYLQTTIAAARIDFNFDNEDATAIETIKAQNAENGEFFDLQGRKVANPTKGLYIVNGKKVIIK